MCCILDRYRRQSHPASSDNSGELGDVRTKTWSVGLCPRKEMLFQQNRCLPCSCVLSLRLDGLARNLSMDAVMEAGSGWEGRE